jgi:hypothetical protein
MSSLDALIQDLVIANRILARDVPAACRWLLSFVAVCKSPC